MAHVSTIPLLLEPALPPGEETPRDTGQPERGRASRARERAARWSAAVLALALRGCGAGAPEELAEPPGVEPTPEAPVTPVVPTTAEPEPFRLDFSKVILRDAPLPRVGNPSKALTQEGAREDLAFFRFFMAKGYAAYDYLREKGTVDWDRAFAQLEVAVEAQESWTARGLYEELVTLPREFFDDGHFWMMLPGQTEQQSVYETAHHRWAPHRFAAADEAKYDPAVCPLPSHALLLEDQLFLSPGGNQRHPVILSRAPLTQLACGGPSPTTLKLTALPITRPRWEAGYSERALDADTYYVRSPHFSPFEPALQQQFVASADDAKAYGTVVLDLRSNQGGDPSYFLDWLVRLGARGELQVGTLVHVDSFAVNVLSNNALVDLLEGPPLSAQAEQRYEEMFANVQIQLEQDLVAQSYERWTAPDHRTPDVPVTLPGTFTGTVLVLVDEHCGSACDMAAALSRQLEDFVVLGTSTTTGLMLSGDYMPVALPNSGVQVWIPTGIVSNPDRNGLEGVGVSPEIWVDEATLDALYPMTPGR